MCVMAANSVRKLSLIGLSYGGFVGYCLAARYCEMVERVVMCSAGVCMEKKDLKEGLFRISDLEEAAKILVPQDPKKLKELVKFALFRPPPLALLPSCSKLWDGVFLRKDSIYKHFRSTECFFSKRVC